MVNKNGTIHLLVALILLPMVTECGILQTESKEPKKAFLTLDESTAPSLEVSTSLSFLVTQEDSLQFEDLTVDTVSPPFYQEYDIREHLRFYALVTNIEEQLVSFRMKVGIDEKTWYNQQKTLEPGQIAQWVYRYQAPVLY